MTTHTDCSVSLLLKGCVQSFGSPSFNIEEEKDLSVKQTKKTPTFGQKNQEGPRFISVWLS